MYSQIIALAPLITASIYDMKYREIPSTIMYLGLIITLIASIIEVYLEHLVHVQPLKPLVIYSLLLDIIIIIFIYFLYKTKFMGEADFYAFLIIVAAQPLIGRNLCIATISYLTLFYYVGLMILYMLVNSCINIVTSHNIIKKLPVKYLIAYLFLAKPVKARDYVSKPGWWYPISDCKGYRISFNLYRNPEDEAIRIKKQLETKCLKEDDYIWVTYGVPAVAVITIAYIISLILGDKPLLAIIAITTGVKVPCIIS